MCFKLYGGSKLDEIASENLFCCVQLLRAIPRRPVMDSEGSETVWFQRSLKLCGFKGVLKTVWFQRSFRGGLKPSVVSEGFQRGLKPSVVSDVSEESETVRVLEGFEMDLKPFFFFKIKLRQNFTIELPYNVKLYRHLGSSLNTL